MPESLMVVVMMMTLVFLLLAVAYYVVIERKLMGAAQLRHGPNKSGVVGLFLPVADGVKLLAKEVVIPKSSGTVCFLAAPLFLFVLSYSAWVTYPSSSPLFFLMYSILYYMCLISTAVFGVVGSGFGSGSQYGVLGGMRGVAQSISYELVFNTSLFTSLLVLCSFELFEVSSWGFCFMYMLEVFLVWVVSNLAELNRLPFDFVEGESELVSGYMVEHGGLAFTGIILSEYSSILYSSMVTISLFFDLKGRIFGDVVFSVMVVSFSFVYVLVRSGLPRYRYDKLMGFCWEMMLPLVTSMFLLYMVLAL